MENCEKKVIVFIVEGQSDKAALGTILEEYFETSEIKFVVVHGDGTSDVHISKDEIVKRINELVDEVRKRYRYEVSDLLEIIHIADVDGAFLQDERVREADVDSIQYHEEYMETNHVKKVIRRNHHKKEMFYKLRQTSQIHHIPYRIYYNSANLEHVLVGELKPFTDEEKMIIADEFAERYEGKVSEFISYISGAAAPGSYRETWDHIEREVCLIKRCTNMNLIFSSPAS